MNVNNLTDNLINDEEIIRANKVFEVPYKFKCTDIFEEILIQNINKNLVYQDLSKTQPFLLIHYKNGGEYHLLASNENKWMRYNEMFFLVYGLQL